MAASLQEPRTKTSGSLELHHLCDLNTLLVGHTKIQIKACASGGSLAVLWR